MPTMIDKLNDILDEKQSKIIPENIKAGVTAFGVTGTYEGGSTPTDPYVFPEFNLTRNFNNIKNLQVGTHIRCRLLDSIIHPNINTTPIVKTNQGYNLNIRASDTGSESASQFTKQVQLTGRTYGCPGGAYFYEKTGKNIHPAIYGDNLAYLNRNIVNTFEIDVDSAGIDIDNNPGWYKISSNEWGYNYEKVSQAYIDEWNNEHFKLENIVSYFYHGYNESMFDDECMCVANFIQVEIINN